MEQKETKDAEVELVPVSEAQNPEELAKKRKREAYFELTLFFILGILLGITFKTEAVKRITMGFNDYQIIAPKEKYNIEYLKENLQQEMARQQEQIQQQAAQVQAQQQDAEASEESSEDDEKQL